MNKLDNYQSNSSGMGLKNLLSEPQRLQYEADKVNSEFEALVMDNYKIFIENLTCSVHLRKEVSA